MKFGQAMLGFLGVAHLGLAVLHSENWQDVMVGLPARSHALLTIVKTVLG